MTSKKWFHLLGVGAVAVLAMPQLATAQQDNLTFTRDIAPILQAKCENCHRPGTAAPMALRTYEEVRPWAPLIKDRVAKRVMPPWPSRCFAR